MPTTSVATVHASTSPSPKRGFLRRLFGSSSQKLPPSGSSSSISKDAITTPDTTFAHPILNENPGSSNETPSNTPIRKSAASTNLSKSTLPPSLPMLDVNPSTPGLLPSALETRPNSRRSVGTQDSEVSETVMDSANAPMSTSTSTVHSTVASTAPDYELYSSPSSAVSSNPPSNASVIMNKRSTSLKQEAREFKLVYTEPREVTIAQQIYNGTAQFIPQDEYASWLGSEEQDNILKIYMSLFEFYRVNILEALRSLCEKIYMKGESQQLHRIIEAFSHAWCNQNMDHGFGDTNVVYTIAYSLLLLNTDLYAADHTSTKKMSKRRFAQNTLHAIYSQRENSRPDKGLERHLTQGKRSFDEKEGTVIGFDDIMDSLVLDASLKVFSKEWEKEIDLILRAFYVSVAKEALKLSFVDNEVPASSHIGVSAEPTISNAMSATSRYNPAFNPSSHSSSGPSAVVDINFNTRPHGGSTSGSIFGRMNLNLLRGGNKTYEHESRIGQSSIDRMNGRNNSLRSTFSGETSFSMFGVNKQAVGFAGLLWNSMIKEEEPSTTEDDDETFGDFARIQEELDNEEALELLGAPWVKEGIALYRPYIDPNTGKKNRKKDWMQVFVVVQRGQLKMFKFDSNSSSSAGGPVGGGNWMERANLVDGFHLCHTMAQEAPASKKIKGFNGVWSLTLPQRGLLVFRTGTTDIAREYVYTCNYWAARLSKEPFDEAVSSLEYGWDVDLEKIAPEVTGSNSRRKPGDRLAISEWKPSGQTMVVSDLNEDLQQVNIQNYVERAEKELEYHNALRNKLLASFSAGSQNLARAQANWERKSQYLLQQVIRYKVYSDALKQASVDRQTQLKT